MINIIICDDNEKDRRNIVEVVNNYMNKNKIEFKIHIYKDYNRDFLKIVETKLPFKIYLLDIETPSKSGIDIAREIRKKDVDSPISFLTVHEELGNVVLKNDLMFLSFINKFDDFENRLNECVRKSLEILHHKQVFKFEDRNVIYTINIDDILYITKESFERKTVIVTDYNEFKVSKTLSEIISMLDSRFVQTHRACFINKNRVSRIDKTNKKIMFDNNLIVDLVSDKYKKEIVC